MEFEWKIFPGSTAVAILNEIQKVVKRIQCEPEHFNGRIIFMSMLNDIGACSQVSLLLLVILGTWIRKDLVQDFLINQTEWNRTAEMMILQ